LVNLLRGLRDNALNQSDAKGYKSNEPRTWDALNVELRRAYGAPKIRYDQFDQRWQQEEQLPPEQQILHNLVDRYDGHGLVLKTGGEEQPEQGAKDTDQVSKMAKRATAKALK
jgi:uncharacterized protein YeaO (DUF488 family)